MPRITALYAAPLALLFIVLAFRVIGQRYRTRTALGTGNDPGLERAVRVHANFAEYAPIALLLILLAELLGAAGWWLHLSGAGLLVGRALHAYGVSQSPENLRLRQVGMVLTFSVIIAGAIALPVLVLTR